MARYSLNDQFHKLVKGTVEEKKQMEQNDNTATMTDESAESQDFFQSNNNKKGGKYIITRIKSRNFYELLCLLE